VAGIQGDNYGFRQASRPPLEPPTTEDLAPSRMRIGDLQLLMHALLVCYHAGDKNDLTLHIMPTID
jgi:hypothetical protein